MTDHCPTYPSPPKLPSYGNSDGDQIIDTNGNVFEYNTEQDEWIYHGIIECPDIVTPDVDGIITPAIYRKLLLIQELIERGVDFGVFKLDTPGDLPYYYFFYSSDDLIRFYPESGSKLRLELDRHRLYQKLLRTCCAGPKGLQGSQGAAGRAGVPADTEKFRLPISVTADTFDFEITVDTPIDTALSIRLFRGASLLVEYLLEIAGGSDIISVNAAGHTVLTQDQQQAVELEAEARGEATKGNIDEAVAKLQEIIDMEIGGVDNTRVRGIIDSLNSTGVWPTEDSPLQIILYDENIDIDLTGTEINFDRSTNRLWGTLAFTQGASDITSWKYKARQRGPKGQTGADGSPFLEVSNQVLDDPSVRSSAAIVSIRRSELTGVVTFLNGDMPDDVCVNNLAISAGALPIGDILEAKFMAAKVTTRRCKDIGAYEYNQPEYTPPPLDLPAWEPTPDCVSAAKFGMYKFEWWDLTDPKYPFRVVTPPRPNEQCCVAAGTLIHTDEGLVPIENLKIDSFVLCPDNTFKPITKFFDNGKKECVRLTFSDGGEIICTPDHEIPVGGHLIEAQYLQPYDQIHKTTGVLGWLKEHKTGTNDDLERGYMIGYILGDGWISDKSIGIVDSEKDAEGFFRAHKIISKRFGKMRVQRREPKDDHNEVILMARWGAREARKYFHDLGWYKNLQEMRMDIPPSIYCETFRFYQGFFSGLINSDGCIASSGAVNINYSVLKTLPKTCKRILDYLGISTCLKEHVQSENSFGNDVKPVYRVDVHRGSMGRLVDLLPLAIKRKKENIQSFAEVIMESFIQPPLRHNPYDSDQFHQGLIAGAFMFHGGYNHKTQRASIDIGMPENLRNELPSNLNIPQCGRKYYKKAYRKIGKYIDEKLIKSFDYAVGFLRAVVYSRNGLSNDAFIINRNTEQEFVYTSKCLSKLNIEHKLSEYKTSFNKKQYRITIQKNHHIYKLFMMTNHRNKIGCLGISVPDAGTGVVTVKSREEIGIRNTYNYTVPPLHMMAAEGIFLKQCSEPMFWCPNIGDNPCGVNRWKCGGLEKLPSGVANSQGLSCDGTAREPIIPAPKPMPPPCDCDCDSPIAFELQNGGLSLGIVELGPRPTYQDSYSNSEGSVIDGRTDTYKINFKASGPIDIVIDLRWEPLLCGGAAVEEENCQYREKCEVHSTIIFEDNNSNAEITGGGAAELTAIPGNTAFAVKPIAGTGIDVVLNIMVNDTRSQCCRGYEIRIGAAFSGPSDSGSGLTDVIVVDGNYLPL